MKTHTLIQGSTEWLAYRSQHFNASDAPAMMGCSSYKTRTQLLHEMHTGMTPEVDEGTQRRFDDGHRFEALARPLAEAIIGEDLWPVTGSDGKLSASFDGLTMAEDTAFEHKTLNDELRTVLELIEKGKYAARDLPEQYCVQMEQQLIVSGAERVLFMASKWNGGELVEKRHCWYVSDSQLRAKIIAGWEQFEIDLAAYAPAAAPVVVVAEQVQALPAVLVQVTGDISVKDNFKVFETALRDFLEHRLIREPKTDQDFADLDVQIKAMKGAEAALDSAEVQMLAQVQTIDQAKKTKDMLAKLVRDNRLMAEKLLASEKDRRKAEIVTDGIKALRGHFDDLNKRLGKPYMPADLGTADFVGAVKGLRSLSSMEDAVSTKLAAAKIEANAIADKIQANLATLRELAAAHTFLFADTAQIVLKAPDDLTALVKMRISEYQAAEAVKEEAQRERIRKEEQEKLAREQAAAAQKLIDDAASAAAIASTQAAGITKLVAVIGDADDAPVMLVERIAPAAVHQSSKLTGKMVSIPIKPSVREALNAQLDLLGDVELQRVLSFVQSRYGVAAA